jgi:hypothetical protein
MQGSVSRSGKLLLVLTSKIILGSESRETHDRLATLGVIQLSSDLQGLGNILHLIFRDYQEQTEVIILECVVDSLPRLSE